MALDYTPVIYRNALDSYYDVTYTVRFAVLHFRRFAVIAVFFERPITVGRPYI